MSDIEVGGQQYRCGKLATRTQLHVVKRLVPVMQGMAPLFAISTQRRLTTDADGQAVADFANIPMAEALSALSNTISLLSDADTDYILDAALDVVQWRQGDRWVPLRASPGGPFLLGAADDLALQLRLLWEVLMQSLANFSFATLFGSQMTTGNGMDLTAPMAATG